MSAMNASERREWAKEMMVEFIDQQLQAFLERGDIELSFDDRVELSTQRNRVARFLGQPQREE